MGQAGYRRDSFADARQRVRAYRAGRGRDARWRDAPDAALGCRRRQRPSREVRAWLALHAAAHRSAGPQAGGWLVTGEASFITFGLWVTGKGEVEIAPR